MKSKARLSAVPGRSWEWADGMATSGVHTYGGSLTWWTRPDGPGGYFGEMATEQSCADFLRSGAPVPAPEAVVQALGALLASAR